MRGVRCRPPTWLIWAATAVASFAPLDESESEMWESGGFLQVTSDAPAIAARGRRLPRSLAAVVEECLHQDERARLTVTQVYDRQGAVLDATRTDIRARTVGQ
jgi:hypothetical protein